MQKAATRGNGIHLRFQVVQKHISCLTVLQHCSHIKSSICFM